MSPEQLWFRPKELASRWRVNRTTLWRWVKAGLLAKPKRFGPRLVAWSRSVVVAFEESRS